MELNETAIRAMLRPPGGGIPAFSAGVGAAAAFQRRWYRLPSAEEVSGIESAWHASLRRLGAAKVALLGVPLDTGGGIRRGAARGPLAIREALLQSPEFKNWLQSGAVVDLGDVYVNPHFLHDEMLSDPQIQAAREAMYPQCEASVRNQLPVSGLSQQKLILESFARGFPQLKFFVFGGDHSCAWPVTQVMHEKWGQELAIVQVDAHTDLLPSRLGVKYCFGSWSFHANVLLGAKGRLVQVGTRQSGHERSHWEQTTGVRQFWAAEVLAQVGDDALGAMIQHLHQVGAKKIYFTNDVDGTDEAEVSATGTPVGQGLRSEWVLRLIQALGREFELVAGDVMEVAPDLGVTPEDRRRTCEVAAQYTLETLRALLS